MGAALWRYRGDEINGCHPCGTFTIFRASAENSLGQVIVVSAPVAVALKANNAGR